MFKLIVKETGLQEWETLCEYPQVEQALADYFTLVKGVLDEGMEFSYVVLERDGIRVAFFSYDQYFDIKD